jgi:hypothetical protein
LRKQEYNVITAIQKYTARDIKPHKKADCMNYDYPSQYHETEQRRELLERQVDNPEVAMKAHFAQQFGHIAIRHANGDISVEDFDRFRELYIDKLSKHTLVIDREALGRDFDKWVDTMMPAALADVYDAKIENGSDSLPDFTSPERMSEMNLAGDDTLLRENLRLTEALDETTQENSRFMNQMLGMSRQLREKEAKLTRLQRDYDDLVISASLNQPEDAYSKSSSAS